VLRLDPRTGRVTGHVPLDSTLSGLGVTGAGVWVANDSTGTATRIDPADDRVTATLRVGHAKPAWFAAAPDSLWVANGDDTVSRIDPATAKVTASVRTWGVAGDVRRPGGVRRPVGAQVLEHAGVADRPGWMIAPAARGYPDGGCGSGTSSRACSAASTSWASIVSCTRSGPS
jgi:DNA-binding beta-propeller fold protein YncE